MAAKMIFFNNIKTIRKNVRVRVCWFIISQAFCGKNIFFPLICYSKVYIYLFSVFPLSQEVQVPYGAVFYLFFYSNSMLALVSQGLAVKCKLPVGQNPSLVLTKGKSFKKCDHNHSIHFLFYVLLLYILYVIKSGCFSQSPAFFS